MTAANDSKPLHSVLLFTVMTTVATAVATLVSSYFLIPMKMREEAEKARVERRAKGAQLQCEKLHEAVLLAARVEFVASNKFRHKSAEEMYAEQLAFEERASELDPLLSEHDGGLLTLVIVTHGSIIGRRTSTVPWNQRARREGPDDFTVMRSALHELGVHYRQACSEDDSTPYAEPSFGG